MNTLAIIWALSSKVVDVLQWVQLWPLPDGMHIVRVFQFLGVTQYAQEIWLPSVTGYTSWGRASSQPFESAVWHREAFSDGSLQCLQKTSMSPKYTKQDSHCSPPKAASIGHLREHYTAQRACPWNEKGPDGLPMMSWLCCPCPLPPAIAANWKSGFHPTSPDSYQSKQWGMSPWLWHCSEACSLQPANALPI